jgi:2-dehydropantoate 2-reductase
MRTLVFGAGPLGCLYTHLLDQAGKDVSILARGERYYWIKANGLVLVDELTGAKGSSSVETVDALRPDAEYDLVVVLIRKNKIPPVFEVLVTLSIRSELIGIA